MIAIPVNAQLSPVPLVGVKEILGPQWAEDVRHQWTDTATPEEIADVVARLETIYAGVEPDYRAWQPLMRLARDNALAASGHELEDAVAARREIENQYYDLVSVATGISSIGWTNDRVRIAQSALSGGSTFGLGGIVAADLAGPSGPDACHARGVAIPIKVRQ